MSPSRGMTAGVLTHSVLVLEQRSQRWLFFRTTTTIGLKMNIENYSKEFPKDLAISDLGQTIARLLETETETEVEVLFYRALKVALKTIRLTTCSNCNANLCGDDWDLLGNKTDECEVCNDARYTEKHKKTADTLYDGIFKPPHQD